MALPRCPPIRWDAWDNFVGVIPDKDLAKQIGCTSAAVKRRRLKLKLPPVLKAAWSQTDEELLRLGRIACTICQAELPVQNFDHDAKCRNGRRRRCIACRRSLSRKLRRRAKASLVKLLGSRCQHCGFRRWLGSLQCHHVVGPKLFDPCGRLTVVMTDVLKAELDKCCLLCSNCHDAIQSGELDIRFVKRRVGYTTTRVKEGGDAVSE